MGKQRKTSQHITTFANVVIGGGIPINSGPDLPQSIVNSLDGYAGNDPVQRGTILRMMLEELTALRAEKKAAMEDSVTDPLTGLNNRRHFNESMNALRNSSPLSKRTATGRDFLVLIDLDHFKPLNDKYGHGAGDRALQHLANTLKELVRKTDIVCRIGGDEFAIVLKDSTEQGARRKIAEIKKALKHMSFENEGTTVEFQGSVGFTEINPSAIRTMEQIIHEADKNLYQNKRRANVRQDKLVERQPEPAL